MLVAHFTQYPLIILSICTCVLFQILMHSLAIFGEEARHIEVLLDLTRRQVHHTGRHAVQTFLYGVCWILETH